MFTSDIFAWTPEETYQKAKANCEGNTEDGKTPWVNGDGYIIQNAEPNYIFPLDPKHPKLVSLVQYSGFKFLEVARTEYRDTMNRAFACAVINARTNIINDLLSKVESQYPQAKTEIQRKIDLERKKLDIQSQKYNCSANLSDASPEKINTQLLNTVTYEYCHYGQYLNYLRDTLKTDKTRLFQLEAIIANNSGDIPQNSEDFLKKDSQYMSALDREIDRAKRTLPRAVSAYGDMRRTYAIHILLTVIYDDYIELRKNLSAYFRASTQLFMKADNAQTKK